MVGISLNKTSVTLNKGATDNLTVSYNPTNTTDSKTVTWSSGNTSVAKVDQNGKITAVNKGTTTITAKVGSKTASCNVTVKVPLTGISLNKTTLALNRGVTETLTVNYNPSDTTDSKTVTWSSENTSVAKVDQNGKITAVDVGTTNILAKVGSKTASCSVTVKAPLTGISLNKTTLSLRKQSTETLVVSYDPINTTDDKTITWTSDNEEVATISGGTVSALKEGTATITATVGSCTAQCVVTVEKENTEPVKKPLTAISLDKATMNLKQGSTDTLTVTYTPGDTTDDKTVTWTSEKIDTENKQANNNNMSYDSSNSDNQSSKYPFYVKLDSTDGLMLGQHLYVELDEGQTDAKDGIWLYSGYIVQDEDTPYVWADNGKGKLEKRTVELGEYDEGMDLYEITSGLELTDYIAWPVSGFRIGLKTTTNVDEGMMEEYPDDDMLSEDMGEDMMEEGFREDLSSDGEADAYSMDEDTDSGMVDESDMQPVVDGDSGADTGSSDTPAAE